MLAESRPDRLDRTTRETLRQRLLARGQRLATLLAEVLAGADRLTALAALGLERSGRRPEDVLRDALNQTERRRRLLVAGDDRYGRCEVCDADLGRTALLEVPWADRCAAHADR